MKRRIALIPALVMALVLTGCGKENAAPEKETQIIYVIETEAVEETKEVIYADDLFSAEGITYIVLNNHFNNFHVKIRNISDQKFSHVTFTVQGLDKNGDVVESWFMGSNGPLEAGQAFLFYCRSNFTTTCTSLEEVAEKMEYIKIVEAMIGESLNAKMEVFEFKETPVFKVADIQPET